MYTVSQGGAGCSADPEAFKERRADGKFRYREHWYREGARKRSKVAVYRAGRCAFPVHGVRPLHEKKVSIGPVSWKPFIFFSSCLRFPVGRVVSATAASVDDGIDPVTIFYSPTVRELRNLPRPFPSTRFLCFNPPTAGLSSRTE